ncbi:MAG: hypothetical protein ACK4E8_03245 [Lacibacter sp.]|jgi:hypothetical protein
MHIHIHDQLKLAEIKEVFSNYYPHLQLAFYSGPHKPYETSDEKELLPANAAVQDVKRTHIDGIIDIRPLQTVNKLEQEFQQRFGLPVQVLYKNNGVWTQTTGLDTLSLKELNEISRNDSDQSLIEDYDELEEE